MTLYGNLTGAKSLRRAFYRALSKNNWAIRYHMNEAASPIINQALPGTANGTLVNTTPNVDGGIEGHKTVDFSLSNAVMQIANSSRWNGLNNFSLVAIITPDTSGTGSGFRICQNVGDQLLMSILATGAYDCRVNRTSNATYVSAAGVISFNSKPVMIVMNYDETNGIITYKGQNGVLEQITGGTNNVGSGATTGFTGTLNVFNNASNTRNLDGRVPYFGISNPQLNATSLLQLLKGAYI